MSCTPFCPGTAANDVSVLACAWAVAGEFNRSETTGSAAEASPHFIKALLLTFDMEPIVFALLFENRSIYPEFQLWTPRLRIVRFSRPGHNEFAVKRGS
jgi:hypothetical protein